MGSVNYVFKTRERKCGLFTIVGHIKGILSPHIHKAVFIFFIEMVPKLAFLFVSYNIPGKKLKSNQVS